MLLLAGGAALAGCQPDVTGEPASEATATPQVDATRQPTAAPQPTELAPLDERFVALGTEPFWSVEVSPDQLRYSTPEDIPGAVFAARRSADAGGITYTGSLGDAGVVLRISAGQCSDGMSDTVYAYRAALTLADRELRGCARVGRPGGKP